MFYISPLRDFQYKENFNCQCTNSNTKIRSVFFLSTFLEIMIVSWFWRRNKEINSKKIRFCWDNAYSLLWQIFLWATRRAFFCYIYINSAIIFNNEIVGQILRSVLVSDRPILCPCSWDLKMRINFNILRGKDLFQRVFWPVWILLKLALLECIKIYLILFNYYLCALFWKE